jgi:hypothetical protein
LLAPVKLFGHQHRRYCPPAAQIGVVKPMLTRLSFRASSRFMFCE